ncbi:hypothetical protein O6H91_Y285000 [Diphasiastrum complanatum]|nr:hypothetical protein O6H91_Y285000 [Diphasiastrum complanatum]
MEFQARGKHRGYAFVLMASPEEAKAAIENLNGQYHWGRLLTVGPGYVKTRSRFKYVWEKAMPNPEFFCKVFIGNLNKDTTGPKLVKIFKQYGQIIDAKIVKDLVTKKSRGFAFVTFSNKEEALSAIESCDGSKVDDFMIKANLPLFPK